MKNVLEGLLDELMQAVGAEAENFSTAEGDRIAVVNMHGVISVGILENNDRMANAVFTPVEAKRLAYKLLDYADNL